MPFADDANFDIGAKGLDALPAKSAFDVPKTACPENGIAFGIILIIKIRIQLHGR